jgi:hypothetical protein
VPGLVRLVVELAVLGGHALGNIVAVLANADPADKAEMMRTRSLPG